MQALWIDGFEIRIDALPHVYLDVGLGAGLDVRVIFGEVDLAEIVRLKLLRCKATAHRLLRGAPEKAAERLEHRTALLLQDRTSPRLNSSHSCASRMLPSLWNPHRG